MRDYLKRVCTICLSSLAIALALDALAELYRLTR